MFNWQLAICQALIQRKCVQHAEVELESNVQVEVESDDEVQSLKVWLLFASQRTFLSLNRDSVGI